MCGNMGMSKGKRKLTTLEIGLQFACIPVYICVLLVVLQFHLAFAWPFAFGFTFFKVLVEADPSTHRYTFDSKLFVPARERIHRMSVLKWLTRIEDCMLRNIAQSILRVDGEHILVRFNTVFELLLAAVTKSM